MTSAWNETSLPTILSRYELKDIYNADESGLFYQGPPKKPCTCSGGKYSKVRLTGVAAASAAGEKLRMFVIDKSMKPRCFKNVKSLPYRYRSQEKSWMKSFRFDEWVKELDKKFKMKIAKLFLL